MRESFETAVSVAANHPLIALSIVIFVGVPLLLGWMHELRFFAECGVVGIRFFKHEVLAWRELLKRLKREISTWQ